MSSRTRSERHPSPAPTTLMSLDDVTGRLGVDRKTVERIVASGDLFSVKLGRRRLVPSDSLDDYIAGLVDQARTA